MKFNQYSIVILVVASFAAIGAWYFSSSDSDGAGPAVKASSPSKIPDFLAYQDVKAKKRDFFAFLLPRIRKANDMELENRDYLLELQASEITSDDRERLDALAKRYRIKTDGKTDEVIVEEMLLRADVVPASLILAQGANESAWGTSRFARQGYNFFGIWCFTEGCGMTPKRRDSGASHEVEKFDSVQESVNKYVRTINSHPAYAKLRDVRAEQRASNEALVGAELATGLEKYSERGEEYIEEIQSMISFNELESYNRSAPTTGEG